MQDFYVFKTKYKRDNYVAHREVTPKLNPIHFRPDLELQNDIKELAKELGHTKSKVIKDILRDFFLDRKLENRKFELEGIE